MNESLHFIRQAIINRLTGSVSFDRVDVPIYNRVPTTATEPYVKGAYLRNGEKSKYVYALGESVANKLYFAGEAYTDGNDWGSVHNAAIIICAHVFL